MAGPYRPAAVPAAEKPDTSVSGTVRPMGDSWRYLDLGRQGPFENAATMPVLVRSVAQGGDPIVQTSVWGATHLNVE